MPAPHPDELIGLLQSLQREISNARPGEDQGQFAILDLLQTLADGAEASPEFDPFRQRANQAVRFMIEIVESLQPFTAAQIERLTRAAAELENLLPSARPNCPGPVAETIPPLAADAAPPETSLSLNLDADGELLRAFVQESREHLDQIEHNAVALEQNPNNRETLNSLFRAFHTFKGSAGFLGLDAVSRLAHSLESLLDSARQGALGISAAAIDLILRGRDRLRQFIDEIDAQLAGSSPSHARPIAIADLESALQSFLQAPAASNPAAAPARSPAAARPIPPAPAPANAASGGAIKVDTQKLDALIDFVGELVITESLLAQSLARASESDPALARTLVQFNRITRELQRVGLSLRMAPIRAAFQKMARVTRDLAAKQDKQVRLVTAGDETELDRNMLEALSDPLLHMMRNAIDHGIESPAARRAAGKPECGTIALRAFHHAGNIVLQIQDDGAGLDREKIIARGLQTGCLSDPAGRKLDDREIFELIFRPGFSTAEKITDISGRGVGLDVVLQNIVKLRGAIEVASTPGQGALFTLTLPLTLAIIDGLVIAVGPERFILPTAAVRECFRADRGALVSIPSGGHAAEAARSQAQPNAAPPARAAGELVNVRGRLVPMLRLHECFGLTPASPDPADGIMVLAQMGAAQRCLLADAVLNRQEVVIKTLGPIVQQHNRGLAGAAILGDGRVGLILDPNSLLESRRRAA